MGKFVPRDYQTDICSAGLEILVEHSLLILNMEVRTGKTLTSMMIANELGVKKVLFVTKKKIIESKTIQNDYKLIDPCFELIEINLESVHKVTDQDIDLVILDESHRVSGFPKASLGAKRMKQLVGDKYLILMTGTLTPESYSQVYHQLWISPNSPFSAYRNFYSWVRDFVEVKDKRVAYGRIVKDYSHADRDLISEYIDPITITFTQEQSGFKSKIKEHVLEVDMNESTYNLANKLIKDLIVEKGDISIVADTPVKLQSKLHQIYSGTIKLDDDMGRIGFDPSKAEFIRDHFAGQKIAIIYKFIAEKNLLEEVFGDTITNNIDEFNNSDKNFYGQITSSREGISLKAADALVYYNIDFSALSYWQSRDRMTTINRKLSNIYWIFSKGGIENKIYNTVLKKKSYTTYYFKRDYLK